MRVKICGITNLKDALLAEAAGADALGFIFVEKSKRYVTPEVVQPIVAALGPFVSKVGVFVDATLKEIQEVARAARLDTIQLHGREPAEVAAELCKEFKVIKVFAFAPDLNIETLKNYPADAIMLDGIKPGSGEMFAWADASFLRGFPRLILAGGLDPENVTAGIETLQPYAVDVASGVEASVGVKNGEKVRRFISQAKGARARESARI